MNIKHIKLTAYTASALFLASCGAQKQVSSPSQPKKTVVTKPAAPKAETKPEDTEAELRNLQLPDVPREFRGAWVATVANISWPTKGNFSPERQKEEAMNILNLLKQANFNAVILQVRPSADALYKSNLEPWSYFLTGEIGKAPTPFYDPLEFWISEAHKRGMELHVWLNPYRAHHTSGGGVTEKSIVNKFGGDVVKLKNGMWWFDPSSQKVQDHVSAVVKDLVKRYDIDAVHFDDYFYPYAEYNGGRDFPDSKSWAVYQASGGTLSKADWRRGSVNKFVKRMYDEIHAEKKFVKFGIAPFGIWKSGYPSDVRGSSQYDDLFADAKLWLNEGWVDYFSPQLYWKEGGAQSFSSLLKWWQSENTKKRHLWPGINTVEVRGVQDRPTEIVGQIQTDRNLIKNGAGVIHWSVDGISKSPAMFSALQNIYKDKALVPASPWLKSEPTVKPELSAQKSGGNIELKWLSRNQDQVTNWLLYTRYGNVWTPEIISPATNSILLPNSKNGKKLEAVALKAVDRDGSESDYAAVKIR